MSKGARSNNNTAAHVRLVVCVRMCARVFVCMCACASARVCVCEILNFK